MPDRVLISTAPDRVVITDLTAASTVVVHAGQTSTVLVGSPADHGQLAGLADDDHAQYVTFIAGGPRPADPGRAGVIWVPD